MTREKINQIMADFYQADDLNYEKVIRVPPPLILSIAPKVASHFDQFGKNVSTANTDNNLKPRIKKMRTELNHVCALLNLVGEENRSFLEKDEIPTTINGLILLGYNLIFEVVEVLQVYIARQEKTSPSKEE